MAGRIPNISRRKPSFLEIPRIIQQAGRRTRSCKRERKRDGRGEGSGGMSIIAGVRVISRCLVYCIFTVFESLMGAAFGRKGRYQLERGGDEGAEGGLTGSKETPPVGEGVDSERMLEGLGCKG